MTRLPLAVGAGIGVLLTLCGCAGAAKEQVSATEWLQENSSVLRDLESFEKPRQQSAVARLRGLGRARGRSVAIAVLRDARVDYRAEVLLGRLLADWRDPESVPVLLKFLRHEDRGAVDIAIEGLASFGHDDYVQRSLTEMARSPDASARMAAAEVMLGNGAQEFFELCARLYSGEEDRRVRGVYVAKFLGSRHPLRDGFLVEALSDKDSAIRESAWSALRGERVASGVDYNPAADPAARARAVARLKQALARR